MQSFHDVSIVIVSTGSHPDLERCVRSCVAQTYPGRSYEVLILHDGTDPIVEDVIANYGKLQDVTSHLVKIEPVALISAAMRWTFLRPIS